MGEGGVRTLEGGMRERGKRKRKVGLLCFDAAAGGGEDVCEGCLFEDGPEGSGGC